jgi:RNA polymerase sigma factor (TIGR02999 family)
MSATPAPDAPLTVMLDAWQQGDGAAFSKVFDQAYDQLKRIAAQRLREVGGDSTLAPTELLHEAVLRIADAPKDWQNRAHFFASMSLYIRAVLVDHARARATKKRGGRNIHLTLTSADLGDESNISDLLALDQALHMLEALDARSAEVLHLTYFAGLDRQQIADVLQVSLATVDRELRFARAWLNQHLDYPA